MVDSIFLDSNILIYAYSDTEAWKRERVLSIIESGNLTISTQVVNEFIWIMNRKYGIFLNILKAIVGNMFEIFNVSLISRGVIDNAIGISERWGYTYWDSLILSSALETDCMAIYTEDMRHGHILDNGLKITNPFL